jgi:soluble lytic murein transglycosylase-like protein
MTRPVTQQRGGPAYGIAQRGATVGLEVNAPLNVRTGPSSAESLARVLGVVAEPVVQHAANTLQVEGRKTAVAGATDAALGKINADKYREKEGRGGLMNFERRTYSESVDRYEAVRAFQGAANEVSEWINTEGATLPPGEFEMQLDQRMKEALGEDFAEDPLQAAEIAQRYAPFMAKAVAAHRDAATNAQKQRNLETATTDVMSRLAAGEAVDLQFEIAELTRTQGDRAFAVKALVASYEEAALQVAREGDPATAQERANAVLAQLDGALTGDDGKPLPGPGKSAIHAAGLQTTRDQIAKIHEDRNAATRAVEKFRIEADFQDQVDAGELIGMDQLIPLGQAGILSDQEMLEWYRKGTDTHATKRMQQERMNYLLETQDRSWANLIGTIGPDGKEITQEMLEDDLVQILSAYPPDQQFAAAADWTAKTGLVYKPLAARLANINAQADPKDILALHDEYAQLQARGLAGQYVKDVKVAAQYERISDLRTLGLTEESLAAELRRSPEEAEAYFKAHERDLRDAQADIEVFDLMPGDDDLLNSPYVQRALDTYAAIGLRQGLSPERAAEFSKSRFEEGHMAIETPSGTMILPKVAGVSQEAMEWVYTELLPEYAERKGLDASQVRLTPIGPNGEMILTDQYGMRVTPEVFNPTTMTQTFEARKRESAILQFKDTAEMERLKRTDPAAFQTMQRRAAIERGRKADADLRAFNTERARKVVGGANNLPVSTFSTALPSTPGGTTRGRRKPAAPAATPEAPAVSPAVPKPTAEYLSSVASNEDVAAKQERAVNWQSNDLAEKAAPYLPDIQAASAKHGIPVQALGAQIAQESRFNPDATSHAGAEGLMQIVPKWHPSMRGRTRDTAAAIDYGAKYMRDLYDQFGSWDKALAAYNTGPGNLLAAMRRAQNRHGDSSQWPRYVEKETREYVAILLPAYVNS